MDTAIDVPGYDQFVIVLRYLFGKEMEERKTGFYDASNMSSKYSGVLSRLHDLVPNHLHIWCYAHVLNLIMFVPVISGRLDVKMEEDSSLNEESLYLEMELPHNRVIKDKEMPGKLAEDETASCEMDRFRMKIFIVIIDTLNQSMMSRVADQKNLYLDHTCFDARRFSELK
ncbi:hypothetical protein PR048_023411 [Dryococelus australis]|uniref:Uncharacterized protein n=1 Tax=Dryococelus australis TaxID=614101 RepID=A0ABQ9GU05_9NEOP|nr:hypothetical protein PR048_023411 [Dryococelus australis]